MGHHDERTTTMNLLAAKIIRNEIVEFGIRGRRVLAEVKRLGLVQQFIADAKAVA